MRVQRQYNKLLEIAVIQKVNLARVKALQNAGEAYKLYNALDLMLNYKHHLRTTAKLKTGFLIISRKSIKVLEPGGVKQATEILLLNMLII